MKNNFFTLVGYEYKKIFKRKSSYFAFFIIAVVVFFSAFSTIIGYRYVDGVKDKSRYDQMKIEREDARKLSGYLDEEKISLVIEQNNVAYANPQNFITEDGGSYLSNEAYDKYIRPYGEIGYLLKKVYAPKNKTYDGNAINRLTANDAKDFYIKRLEKVDEILADGDFTQGEIAMYEKMNSQIKTPFYYSFIDGYSIILGVNAAVAIFTALAISICIAPIFAGEYSNRTDQIILTTKNGKSKEIHAKIFTSVTFSLIVAVFSLSITVLSILLIYGFDGASVNLQVLYPFLPYPINMLQAILILLSVSIMAILLVSIFSIFMSSKLKTPFGVIIASNLVLFVPMFIEVPETNRVLSYILRLMPMKMFEMQYVLSNKFFCIGNLVIKPYVLLPVFCLLLCALLIPLTYRAFKNHQIS